MSRLSGSSVSAPGVGHVRSIPELLRGRAAADPDGRAYTFLEDGERPGDCLTWGELDRRPSCFPLLPWEPYFPDIPDLHRTVSPLRIPINMLSKRLYNS